VQTVASAAGTLSSIIFVLPGLIHDRLLTEFPFWTSFWSARSAEFWELCSQFPLRCALVTTSDLPYPEGVACAEVLKVGSTATLPTRPMSNTAAPVCSRVWGSIVSAIFAVIVGTQIFAADVAQTFRIGRRGAVSGL